MNTQEAIFAFIGFAALVSILCTTSFVAMVIANAVQKRPDLVDVDDKMIDIAAKVSKFTFFVSGFFAMLVYMFGSIGLIFGIPLGVISFLSQATS